LRIRREQAVAEVSLAAPGKAFEECGAEHSGESADVAGGEHRPAARSETRPLNSERSVELASASAVRVPVPPDAPHAKPWRRAR